MSVPIPLPGRILELENVWIPLADGCRLAARIWLPEGAETNPVPAIFEYLPYRKRDGTAERDDITHPFFARNGYACLRVDMRGNGESDGLMLDEYLKQEQDDALEVIDWITSQAWCSGQVGIIGISWGGFNGLQIAARRPKALKAVVSLCSTDDRYADDIHYMGGCLLNYNLGWAAHMLSISTQPPDPVLAGDSWRETWLNRLENLPFLAEPWLEHQHRDAYWKHGSICENYGDIEAAVLLSCGWADGYSNTVFRMMENLSCPKKAIVGPWSHKYPNLGLPGPAMGFLSESLRWWDRWLKNADNGVEKEKPLQLYMQDSLPPKADYDFVPGRWVGENAWPPPGVEPRTFYLGAYGLTRRKQGQANLRVASPQTTGSRGGRWYTAAPGDELPIDQWPDDHKSLCCDGQPLTETLEICGAPLVELTLTSDSPQALLAVRLCDLRPDGSSTRVSYGLLNLTHADSHEFPQELTPGGARKVRIQLNEIAWSFPPGHRLRLAISNAYWPMVWPSPENNIISLQSDECRLHLPTRPVEAGDLPDMAPAEDLPGSDVTRLRPAKKTWHIEENAGNGTITTRLCEDHGERVFNTHGMRNSLIGRETYYIEPNNPLSARMETHWSLDMGRGDWRVSSESRTSLSCTADYFNLAAEVDVYENRKRIFSKVWRKSIPRKLV